MKEDRHACALQDSSFRIFRAATSTNADAGTLCAYIPPQLFTSDMVDAVFSERDSRLYVLLANSLIHVWQLDCSGGSPNLAAVWNHFARDQLTCLALLPLTAFPAKRSLALGFLNSDEQDAVVLAGTTDGDVVAMHLATGAPLLRFCAHRLCKISHLVVCEEHARLLSISSCTAKVWNLGSAKLKVAGTVSTGHVVTKACKFEHHFVLGTSSGHVHFVDMLWGRSQPCVDRHAAAVSAVASSATVKHALTGSVDGCLMLWAANGAVARKILVGQSISSATFLTTRGDLLIGIKNTLTQLPVASFNHTLMIRQDSNGAIRCLSHIQLVRLDSAGLDKCVCCQLDTRSIISQPQASRTHVINKHAHFTT
jgi:hypothetical protein